MLYSHDYSYCISIIPHFLHLDGAQAFCREQHPQGSDDGNFFVTPSWALQFLNWAVDGKPPSDGGPDGADDAAPEVEQEEEEEEQESDEEEAEPTENRQEIEPRANRQGVYPRTYKKEVRHCTLEFVC